MSHGCNALIQSLFKFCGLSIPSRPALCPHSTIGAGMRLHCIPCHDVLLSFNLEQLFSSPSPSRFWDFWGVQVKCLVTCSSLGFVWGVLGIRFQWCNVDRNTTEAISSSVPHTPSACLNLGTVDWSLGWLVTWVRWLSALWGHYFSLCNYYNINGKIL